MKAVVPIIKGQTIDRLMEQAGYSRHCVQGGKSCYHRRLCDPAFPRFHALIRILDNQIEIDLHFDQKNLNQKGNHDKPWAYQGGRVNGELSRIVEVLRGMRKKATINSPNGYQHKKKAESSKPKNLFQILFR